MGRLDIIYANPKLPLPISCLKRPFAVLLDARDCEWANSLWISREVHELLHVGCRYFVCFGPGSEVIHDQIDDVIIGWGSNDVVPTTFHEDETVEDVANFFEVVALSGMAQGLLLVNDEVEWKMKF